MDFSKAIVLGDGGSLSVKHERIAEIIRDLNPTLELAYIPEAQRSSFDKHPFAIIHRPNIGEPYIAMTMTENEVDERLIQKLIQRDTTKGAVLDELEAHEAALRLVKAKSDMDEADEKRDLAQSILKSPKNVYRHNGVVYK